MRGLYVKDHQTSRRRETARDTDPIGRIEARRRNLRLGVVSAIVIVTLVIVASVVTVPYEAITPGSTVEISKLISIPGQPPPPTSGSVSLVDVNLVPLRAINFLFFRLNPDNQIVSNGQILGTNSQAIYDEQGVLDMASAQQAATYVALRQLGYAISARPTGVAVYEIESHSPAATAASEGSLEVGDVIQDVGGVAVSDSASLREELLRYRIGEPVALTVHHFGHSKRHAVVIRPGQLSAKGAGGEVCIPRTGIIDRSIRARTGTPCLGVVLMPMYQVVNQPFPINLDAEGIIGPSAGLAFTLGIIQKLDLLDLTHGLAIAATGTIAMDGAVGDVGGVRQKTIAVRNDGASVFFVPKSEFRLAQANAGPKLRVFPVASISQAIQDLERLGGRIFKRPPR